MRDFVFQVRPRLRYEAYKEFAAFKSKFEKSHSKDSKEATITAADDIRMMQLKKKLEEELKENRSIMDRRVGETVCYGQEIELAHYDSNGLIEASKTVAEFDK